MTTARLKSPTEAEKEIAKMFQNGGQCVISAREEGAFADEEWLGLGTVCLARVPADSVDLVKFGAFEWCLPGMGTVQDELRKRLGIERDNLNSNPGLLRALDDISSIGIRLGLLQPLFDPATLEDMPYRRSTTVVSDTSGVLQGGLDFIARYLHPAARVKIPAIVHMELVNSAERFFSLRRSERERNPNRRRHELVEHLKSQGGQRTLLRLELQTDTEVERTFLLGDPLRSAFQTERGELSDLNLAMPVKSYVDRLILEAARHHQAQSGPTHEVRLLTSDQGLARMALAEGVSPLYFMATKAADFFGARLTGRTFDPFTGEVCGTSLAAVLWELATAFGSVRLESKDAKTAFRVSALGKKMSWSPYHSVDDLLWCESMLASNASTVANGGVESVDSDPQAALPEDKPAPSQRPVSLRKSTFFRFDVGQLFRLICALDDHQVMNVEEVGEALGIKSRRGSEEYQRFLLSTKLISIEGQVWQAGSQLGKLAAALRNERTVEIHDVLCTAASYAAFASLIAELEIGQTLEHSRLGRGTPTYRTLGEITLLCAGVQGEGIYPTPRILSAAEFALLALSRYGELEGGDGLVAAGAWLESLVRKDGIHPELARRRLDEASRNGLLRRSTEGSTMQVRHDDHILHVLRSESQVPSVVPIHLYRGDYLIPGKASVSLRLEGGKQ